MPMKTAKAGTQLAGIANLALLAPVKTGFVPGAETWTYARRLESLLTTLNAIRKASREAAIHRSPFPDAVGRWGLLQSFRYAVIPPELAWQTDAHPPPLEATPAQARLYLNVSFDAGTEPYLRVIHRDLGSLLDTIFCNCAGYPGASGRTAFADYVRWVRQQEVSAGLYYTDSARTVPDGRWLDDADRAWRQAADPAAAQRALAGHALPAVPEARAVLQQFAALAPEARREVLSNQLRALKGLYDLRALYPANGDGDDATLLNFARKAMPEFRALLAPGDVLQNPALASFRVPAAWLVGPAPAAPQPGWAPPTLDAPPGDVQLGVTAGFPGATHGALLLLAVTDADRARAFLKALPLSTVAAPLPADGIWRNVAFTRQGLQALGVGSDDAALAQRFPQEFIDGMEARAGLLGDVRGNHPDQWRRPRYKGREVDLRSVHLVLQLRIAAPAPELAAVPLHPRLQAWAASMSPDVQGLRLLALEPMRSQPDANGRTREHFGFLDGFSQPQLRPPAAPAAAHWSDHVGPGDLLLGHANDSGDPPGLPAQDPLLKNGSFLVVRKIRQDVAAYRRVRRAAAAARDPLFEARNPAEQAAAERGLGEKMIGRREDGVPLVPGANAAGNDFDYRDDPAGVHCPFQSHVRRSNPRTGAAPQRPLPRIVRRGMSYGLPYDRDPAGERGLFFMAYCASLAEQFEVLQRWVAGGNATGIPSTQSDPLLGVPQPGQSRSFQWRDETGAAVRIDLGEQALTRLEWGLYLFAPSQTGLAELCKPVAERALAPLPAVAAPAPAARPPSLAGEPVGPAGEDFERWRRRIQNEPDRDALWADVRAAGGDWLAAPYGRLVCDKDKVLALLRDPGADHSVCGYGRRFAGSIGPGYLGMDAAPHGDHTRLAVASGANAAVAAVTEAEAFAAAFAATTRWLDDWVPPSQAGQPLPVDLVELGERVVGDLSTLWFGLPDGQHMRLGSSARKFDEPGFEGACFPRDFVYVARHIFGPHPTDVERLHGIERGQVIRAATQAWLATGPALPETARRVRDGLERVGATAEQVAHVLAGLMLGFGPSTLGNWALIVRRLVEAQLEAGPTLWDLQAALLDDAPPPQAPTHAQAELALRTALIGQLRKAIVPATVWREAAGSTAAGGEPEPAKVVIGLHGLATDRSITDAEVEPLLFGGTGLGTVHACPGHGMAIGTLLGLLAALLAAGTLRTTPSPTILNLVR